jgi:Peptidyl-tRNA hydrolase
MVADFVLSAPAKGEWDSMVSAFDFAGSCVQQMVAGDISVVMNKLNSV